MKATVTLPPVGAADVVSRELHVLVNGNDVSPAPLDVNTPDYTFEVQNNDSLELWLVDIDGAGNRSPESEHLTGTAADTFPPPQPGALGLTLSE